MIGLFGLVKDIVCPQDILVNDWFLDIVLDDVVPEPGVTIDSYGRSLSE